MDSLPYDLAMNDNADLPDTTSQVNNSYEKSDEDMFTVKMANIGGTGLVVETKSVKIDQGDYVADLSNGVTTKQLTATTDPAAAPYPRALSVTFMVSEEKLLLAVAETDSFKPLVK